MKKLGFGLMRLPLVDKADPAAVDVEQVKEMVDLFLERGFTYFDTAWMYCGFHSENVTREALVDRYPREAFTLATKLHSGFLTAWRTGIRCFLSRWPRPGRNILTIISFMEFPRAVMENMRSLTALAGCGRKRSRAL